jgi:hypothetical protein
MYRFTAMEEGIGASRLELLFYKSVYLLTFKKSTFLAFQIAKITGDIEKVKNRKVF